MTWWLPLILVTVKPARSKARTSLTPGGQESRKASGDVERQRQLLRCTNLLDERGQRATQILDRLFGAGAISHRTDTGPELSGRTPNTVFVLFDGVRHMNNAAHTASFSQTSAERGSMTASSRRGRRGC